MRWTLMTCGETIARPHLDGAAQQVDGLHQLFDGAPELAPADPEVLRQEGGSLRTSTRTEIRLARMSHLRGECSYRRAEEEEIQRRASACTQQPPCQVLVTHKQVPGCRDAS